MSDQIQCWSDILSDHFKKIIMHTEYVAIEDWKMKLVRFGCHGTGANIAEGGLKEFLKKEVPCIAMFWCLAHRLELSIKHALNPTFSV